MGHTTEVDLVALAEEIATRAHQGQVDKAGAPYIEHPRRVARRLLELWPSAPAEARAAALLHDVVEDTPITLEQLRAAGFPENVVAAVDAVTKRPEESVEGYFARIRSDPLAPWVKAADLADNTDSERLSRLPKKTRARLQAKYTRARQLLGEDHVQSDR